MRAVWSGQLGQTVVINSGQQGAGDGFLELTAGTATFSSQFNTKNLAERYLLHCPKV